MDLGNNISVYVNGTPWKTNYAALNVDHAEYSIDPSEVIAFFQDGSGDNEEATTHVSTLAVFSNALDAVEVSGLGGPGIAVIPNPSNQVPVVAAQPGGPIAANIGVPESYDVTPSDPDGDLVQVQIDWGDGTVSPWTAFGSSGGHSRSSTHGVPQGPTLCERGRVIQRGRSQPG